MGSTYDQGVCTGQVVFITCPGLAYQAAAVRTDPVRSVGDRCRHAAPCRV